MSKKWPFFIFALFFSLFLVPKQTFAQTVSQGSQLSTSVLQVNFNPVDPSTGANLAEKYYKFALYQGSVNATINQEYVLASQGLTAASHGRVGISIARVINIATFPGASDYSNGFTGYDMNSYSPCTSSQTSAGCETNKKSFLFQKWFDENQICQQADQAKANEIWIISNTYLLDQEWYLVLPSDSKYQPLAGAGFVDSNCNHPYWIMNATYDRYDKILHDWGHRIEFTLQFLTKNWSDQDYVNDWLRFSRLDLYGGDSYGWTRNNSPTVQSLMKPYIDGKIGCGNTHFPVNTTGAYDYSNQANSNFNCKDWTNIPNFNYQTQSLNCASWTCGSDYNWQKVWLGAIPSNDGQIQLTTKTGTKFTLNTNWWPYVMSVDTALATYNSTCPPPQTGSASVMGVSTQNTLLAQGVPIPTPPGPTGVPLGTPPPTSTGVPLGTPPVSTIPPTPTPVPPVTTIPPTSTPTSVPTATPAPTATPNTFCSAPLPGPVAYYPFDNSSQFNNTVTGGVKDTSGNNNNGTVQGNAASSVLQIGSTCGKWGAAGACFQQSSFGNAWIDIPTSSSLNITGPITVTAWVNTSVVSHDDMGIVSKWDTNSRRGFALVINNTTGQWPNVPNGVRFDLYNGTNSISPINKTVVTDGKWHFIVGIYDGVTAKVYVDGVDGTDISAAGYNVPMVNANMNIGNQPVGPFPFLFYGSMDEVRVYNRALSPQEITGLLLNNNTQIGTGGLGDTNNDGIVNNIDYTTWLVFYSQSATNGYQSGDFNGDGVVDGLDYIYWLNNYKP